MIDLKPFCGDRHRPEIMEPFSTGAWSYATDGHIAVRVPREDDIPKRENQPKKVADLFNSHMKDIEFSPLRMALPVPLPCATCGGRERLHVCPSCQCKCPECDGKNPDEFSVGIRGANFRGDLVRRILTLPEVTFASLHFTEDWAPLAFKFAGGGQGLIMPYRGRMKVHIEEPTETNSMMETA
jgi:hypothetical protein